MKNNSKFNRGSIVSFMVVIVALLIIGGIYLIWKNNQNKQSVVPTAIPSSTTTQQVIPSVPQVTSTSTADWKTYTSEKYGFTFQYPPSLIPVDENSQINLDLSSLNSLKNIQLVEISISNNPGPCGQSDASYPNPLRHQPSQDFTNAQGIDFQFFSTGESGMEHYSATDLFRTEYSGNCYVGVFGAGYTSDVNNSQWLPQTNAALDNYMSLLKQIMMTVTITN